MDITEVSDVVSRCKNGESEAWEMIINSYSKPVYNIALNFIADKDIAADITQDIFLKLYQNIGKFKEEKNFSAWLFTLSRNYCIDYWRKNKRYLQCDVLDDKLSADSPTPEQDTIREAEIARLRISIRRLDPELRIFLILRDILNLTYQQIASKFGVPEGTVKSRINRARIKLTELHIQGE
jgi:RNA polymerase sigma-70 factor (ECF subfamily)